MFLRGKTPDDLRRLFNKSAVVEYRMNSDSSSSNGSSRKASSSSKGD